MTRIDTINRLPVPEIAGHTTSGGRITYAVREPGEEEWRGVACDGGPTVQTLGTYPEPQRAIHAAIWILNRREATR